MLCDKTFITIKLLIIINWQNVIGFCWTWLPCTFCYCAAHWSFTLRHHALFKYSSYVLLFKLLIFSTTYLDAMVNLLLLMLACINFSLEKLVNFWKRFINLNVQCTQLIYFIFFVKFRKINKINLSKIIFLN